MKIIATILSTLTVSCLVLSISAQSPPPSTSGLPVAHGSPVPLTHAVIKALFASNAVDLQFTSVGLQHYRLARNPTFIGPGGKALTVADLKAGMNVSVHFMQDGNEYLVDRIFVE